MVVPGNAAEMSGGLQLDHVSFIMAESEADDAREKLGAAGLVESSSRRHSGQGTANVFYCFDNAFVELLWITDREETVHPASQRLGLISRADWRTTGAMPFTVALRTLPASLPLPFRTWDYLPASATGMHATTVAISSDAVEQPLIFRAQRNLAPIDWTDGRAGRRQIPTGLSRIGRVQLDLPEGVSASADLVTLTSLDIVSIGKDRGPRMRLEVLDEGDRFARIITFPDFSCETVEGGIT